MWKIVFQSVTGTSHASSGAPCQDFCDCKIVEEGSEEYLIVACCDGAGSAKYSDLGAKIVTQHFCCLAIDWIKEEDKTNPPVHEIIYDWIEKIRSKLNAEADLNHSNLREFACTFLGAIVAKGWVVFIQIGDGAIVFNNNHQYEIAFWPDNGEYANVTYFITDDSFRDHLKIERLNNQLSEIAIFTDGLQSLALDYVKSQPHAPFFLPLFKTVKMSIDNMKLKEDLIEYLTSERMNQRTDDDKSLIIATRIVPEASIDEITTSNS